MITNMLNRGQNSGEFISQQWQWVVMVSQTDGELILTANPYGDFVMVNDGDALCADWVLAVAIVLVNGWLIMVGKG